MSAAQVANQARVDGEPADVAVELGPGRERARHSEGTTPGGRTREHRDVLPQQRVTEPLRVQTHAGLLLVAIVVQEGDPQGGRNRTPKRWSAPVGRLAVVTAFLARAYGISDTYEPTWR